MGLFYFALLEVRKLVFESGLFVIGWEMRIVSRKEDAILRVLKKNEEFERVFKRGKWFRSEFLILYVNTNGEETNRIGIAVGKKVAKSVKRHRIKRLIKEAYRLHEAEWQVRYDMVVLWKGGAEDANLTFQAVEKDLLTCLKKAGLFPAANGEKE